MYPRRLVPLIMRGLSWLGCVPVKGAVLLPAVERRLRKRRRVCVGLGLWGWGGECGDEVCVGASAVRVERVPALRSTR